MLNKFLIGTMLLAPVQPYNTNILGKTNQFQSSYIQSEWIVEQDTPDTIYQKYKTATLETHENDVLKIEAKTYYVYQSDKENESNQLAAWNIIRITPKAESIIDPQIRVQSYYNQMYLEMELNSSCTTAKTIANTTQNYQATQFFNGTSDGLGLKNSIKASDNYKETYLEEDYEVLEIFANPEEFNYQGTIQNTAPLLLLVELNITNTSKTMWSDNIDYLANTPSSLTGSYNWQIDMDTANVGEVVDIPGLLFEILGMPFAFMSQAFNLTIFPGTIYELNLSYIFLALIVSGIIIFIIKKVFK